MCFKEKKRAGSKSAAKAAFKTVINLISHIGLRSASIILAVLLMLVITVPEAETDLYTYQSGTKNAGPRENPRPQSSSETFPAASSAASSPASVSLDKSDLSLNAGETEALNIVLLQSYADAASIVWSSSDKTVATVLNGTVTAVGSGKCVVSVTGFGVTASCNVTVAAPPPPPAPAAKAFHSSELSGSSQIITVTANGMNTSSASLKAYEKSGGVWTVKLTASAYIGRYGLVYDAQRIEGDKKTPAGIYGFCYAFGSEPNPGTKLQYRQSDDSSYFDENSGSPNYNSWVEYDPGGNREFMKIPQYKYGLLLDFNPDKTLDKGSGMFLHVKGSYTYTNGCISLNKAAVVSLLKWLSPAKNPKILICPRSGLSKYYY